PARSTAACNAASAPMRNGLGPGTCPVRASARPAFRAHAAVLARAHRRKRLLLHPLGKGGVEDLLVPFAVAFRSSRLPPLLPKQNPQRVTRPSVAAATAPVPVRPSRWNRR